MVVVMMMAVDVVVAVVIVVVGLTVCRILCIIDDSNLMFPDNPR